MVRLQTLDLRIGVRVPASQPILSQRSVAMKILSLFLFLVLFRPMIAQNAAGASPAKQPSPDVDQALRARVTKFYQAYLTGKFSEAYPLVAPEAQDAFFRADKPDYQECQISKIEYDENFNKALVTETCKGIWVWHGHTSPMEVPVESHWKLVDNQWLWYFAKRTRVPNPFSPTGYTELPPDDPEPTTRSLPVLKNMPAVAASILTQVKVDKNSVVLRADSDSKDTLQVRNDMPGEVNLIVGPSPLAGLKITASKTQLKANESAVVTFEYALDDKSIACSDCATHVRSAQVQLSIMPTGQIFKIAVNFTNQKSEQFALPKK
jgi:hypothetical protein